MSDRYFAYAYRLVVENIGVEDDGAYTITASNSVGETIATAKLVCHSKKQNLFLVLFIKNLLL